MSLCLCGIEIKHKGHKMVIDVTFENVHKVIQDMIAFAPDIAEAIFNELEMQLGKVEAEDDTE